MKLCLINDSVIRIMVGFAKKNVEYVVGDEKRICKSV